MPLRDRARSCVRGAKRACVVAYLRRARCLLPFPPMKQPPRPASVPADARYQADSPGFEWIAGPLDDAGEKHGVYLSWTKEGVLHGECTYVHGKLHGENKNFHPDGTNASIGHWREGTLYDCVYYKATGESPEPWPGDAGPTVTSVAYLSRDGKSNYTIRFFAGDTEVANSGAALPPRPATVSPDARWFPNLSLWVDGAIARAGSVQIGPWTWWNGDGELQREEIRAADGKATAVTEYEDGALKRRKAQTADGGEDDEWFRAGVRSAFYRKDGQGRRYYEAHWYTKTGELREETAKTFDAAGLAAVTERGEGGVLRFEAKREGDALACVLYADDGKTPAASGLWRDDKLAGAWRIFDGAGAVRRTVETGTLDRKQKPSHQGLAFTLGRAAYAADEPGFATPRELEGVDAIAWKDVSGCYNDAVGDFPRLLRGIVSGDPLVTLYASGCIDSEIEHQGSTYPATAAVIPWLAKLLTHPAADKSRLLGLIKVAGECAKPYVAEVKDLPADDDNRVGIEGTYLAVGAAWPLVWAQYPTADRIQQQVILAIAKCAPSSRADLVALATEDPDPAVRACAVDSLVAADDGAAAAAVALADRAGLVRTAAAVAIALRSGPEAPPEVVPVLAAAIEGWRELATPWAQLPYTDGHVLAYVALALGSVRAPAARELVAPLCARIDEVDGVSAVTYGRGLCALAFGRGEKPFAAGFVDVVETLAKSKQFWVFNVNAHEVLGMWNFPRGEDALKALAAELRAAGGEAEAVLHARMHGD
jgi:hypothetical protein